jgi:hypothetical protein
LHVIPGLLHVDHFTRKAPFADYSNLAKLRISYEALKNVDIFKLIEKIDNVEILLPKNPGPIIKKIVDKYPNSKVNEDALLVRKPDTSIKWDRFTFVKSLPGKDEMEYTVVINNKKYKVLSSFEITRDTPVIQLERTDKPGYDYEIPFWDRD